MRPVSAGPSVSIPVSMPALWCPLLPFLLLQSTSRAATDTRVPALGCCPNAILVANTSATLSRAVAVDALHKLKGLVEGLSKLGLGAPRAPPPRLVELVKRSSWPGGPDVDDK